MLSCFLWLFGGLQPCMQMTIVFLHFELVLLVFANGDINIGGIYNHYYVYHIP